MMRLCWSAFFALFFLTSISAQEPKGKAPKDSPWTVTGIELTKPSGRFDYPSQFDGTGVAVRCHLRERFIVGIDPAQSKIKISDDKGTDLLVKAPETHLHVIYEPEISADGKKAALTFRASRLPMKGATKIRITGNVVVLVGKDEKTIEKKGVALAQPVDLEVGTLRAVRLSPSEPVSFLSFDGIRPLKKMVVLDAADKMIAFRQSSEYLEAPMAKDKIRGEEQKFRTNLHPSTNLKSGLGRWTFRATYFDTIERMVIPIDLEVGLGF
jgi:hypothetical protein